MKSLRKDAVPLWLLLFEMMSSLLLYLVDVAVAIAAATTNDSPDDAVDGEIRYLDLCPCKTTGTAG